MLFFVPFSEAGASLVVLGATVTQVIVALHNGLAVGTSQLLDTLVITFILIDDPQREKTFNNVSDFENLPRRSSRSY